MALKAEVERLRGVSEMKTKVEITPSLNKQIPNEFEAKRVLFPSTSQHNTRQAEAVKAAFQDKF